MRIWLALVVRSQPDEMVEPELVARRQRLDVRVRDLAVGHADDRAIQCTDARRSQADVIDGPDGLAELEEVADAHRLVEDDRDAADDVLERLLRGERHGNAADAEAGERGGRIDAEVVQHHQHARRRSPPRRRAGARAAASTHLGVTGALAAASERALGGARSIAAAPMPSPPTVRIADPDGPELPARGSRSSSGPEQPADQDRQQHQPD